MGQENPTEKIFLLTYFMTYRIIVFASGGENSERGLYVKYFQTFRIVFKQIFFYSFFEGVVS